MNWVNTGTGEIKWSEFKGGGSSWDRRTPGGSNVILLLLNMDCSAMAWGPHRQSVPIIRPWVQFFGPLAQLWSPLAVWAWLGPGKLRDQSGINRAAEYGGCRFENERQEQKRGRGGGKNHAGRQLRIFLFLQTSLYSCHICSSSYCLLFTYFPLL